MNTKLTQNKTILNHLQSFGSITSYEAFVKYRITRLASRIWEIKKSHDIEKEMVSKDGKTYARYTLKVDILSIRFQTSLQL